MYIQGKFMTYSDDLTEVIKIRREVFIMEQHKTEEEEFDQYDKEAVFCVVYEENNNMTDRIAVGTGRLIRLENGDFKIGRIAVRKEYRGQQYGDMLVKMLVNKAFMSGADEVYVGAQIKAQGFYEKIGFQAYGDVYTEANILHIPMVLKKVNLCKKCQK